MASVPLYGRAIADWVVKYPLAPRWRAEERSWVTGDGGVRLFVARLGGPADAPVTVVLLHGFLNSSRTPRVHAFARLLARHVHVLVPDLRGHGASGGRSTLGLQEPADVAAIVATAPEGVPVVTVGTSLGAATAILHGGAYRGVAGVVAISSPAWWDSRGRAGSARLARFVTSPWGPRAAAVLLRTRIAPFASRSSTSSGWWPG